MYNGKYLPYGKVKGLTNQNCMCNSNVIMSLIRTHMCYMIYASITVSALMNEH